MTEKTITVRCEKFTGQSVDENLTDITLNNVCLSDLLCEFNIDEITQALVDADKSAEVVEGLTREQDFEE